VGHGCLPLERTGRLALRVNQRVRVAPKKVVVERTFGWLMGCRRLVKDYEWLPETAETLIYLAMIRIMVRRLA
jgi:transposase